MTTVHVRRDGIRTRPGLLQPRQISRRGPVAHVALVAGGAMLVGGDAVRLEITVEDGCSLRLEDVGGTVAYPAQGVPSRWEARITLGREALLEWESFPFVLAEGADVERSTDVSLAEGARMLLRETLVLGRTGEAGGRLLSVTRVRGSGGVPVVLEELELEGRAPRAGILGDASVLDTALLVGERPDPLEHGGAVILDLAAPGAMARALRRSAHDGPIDAVWAAWSAQLHRVSGPHGRMDP